MLSNINTDIEDDPDTNMLKDVVKDSSPTRKRDPTSVSGRDVPANVPDRETTGNILNEPDGVPGMSHPGTSWKNREFAGTENRLSLWHGTPWMNHGFSNAGHHRYMLRYTVNATTVFPVGKP